MEFASSFKRCAFGIAVAALAGCGGSQSQSATQAIPQVLTAQHEHGRSWMLPEAKKEDLIYDSGSSTYIFSFQGKLVGSLDVSGGLCSDDKGNVWIAGYPNGSGMKLAEYAHGGQKPIRTIDVPNMSPDACAVDSTTGNIAATGNGADGAVDIYSSGSSYPQILVDKKFYANSATYDGSGNLFILGNRNIRGDLLGVAELPKGAAKFVGRGIINLSGTSGFSWDGKHLVIGDGLHEGGHELFRYVVRGNRLEDRGYGSLDGYSGSLANYWIQGSKAVATVDCLPYSTCAPIYLYSYPAGGYPLKTIGEGIVPEINRSVTISVARNR